MAMGNAKQPHFPRQDPHSVDAAHPKPRNRNGNGNGMTLCKSLFFLLLLLAITLFPSQAPIFIGHTLFSKSWELVHLLFIGVAVCYGLFSRRSPEKTHQTSDNHHHPLSSSHVLPPIFEDGYYHAVFGSDYDDNKSVSHSSSPPSNPPFYTAHSSTVHINPQSKAAPFDPQNPLDDDDNVIQSWSSQYSVGESSRVVVPQANFGGLDQVVGYRPLLGLGLPVRSLKPTFSTGSHSASSSRSSSPSSGRSVDGTNSGDISPTNLERKFDETVLPCQIPWRSNSGRMGIGGENVVVAGGARHISHCRPLSVDEAQFESLRSSSLRSTTSSSSSSSSLPSLMSHSPVGLSPAHSAPSESPSPSPNPKTEEADTQKDSHPPSSNPPAPQQPSIKRNTDAPLNAFHLRRYTNGFLFQKNSPGKLKDEAKVMSGNSGGEGLSFTQKVGRASPKRSDEKPAAPVKASSSRGKSVRTIRPRQYHPVDATEHKGMAKHQTDGKAGEIDGESKAVDLAKHAISKARRGRLSVGGNNKILDTKSHLPKPILPEHQEKEKEECPNPDSVAVKPREDPGREPDLPNEDAADVGKNAAIDDASWQDPAEIDKKASEFIAKFREQIRLQKVESFRKSRGAHIDDA